MNNVTQTILPRTFEVNFTGSSDASLFMLFPRLSGAKRRKNRENVGNVEFVFVVNQSKQHIHRSKNNLKRFKLIKLSKNST